mmetsp:Transcript_2400/g.3565  ORF Transcript_2400/g.3565 Transcript_2400/m.3565 type:complete len:85 (+) Transcript_2400:438-692(+)
MRFLLYQRSNTPIKENVSQNTTNCHHCLPELFGINLGGGICRQGNGKSTGCTAGGASDMSIFRYCMVLFELYSVCKGIDQEILY